jgi:GNAT superfamily N-acetyltransferase
VKHRIRPATDSERRDCAKQWASSFTPHARKVESCEVEGVTIGSAHRSLAPFLWRRAHLALVQSLLWPSLTEGGENPARLDVLVLETVPTEPLGWVCYEPETGALHYVYVVDRARRKGLGSCLLMHAEDHGACRPTCTTASGIGLLDKVKPVDPFADTKPIRIKVGA